MLGSYYSLEVHLLYTGVVLDGEERKERKTDDTDI